MKNNTPTLDYERYYNEELMNDKQQAHSKMHDFLNYIF